MSSYIALTLVLMFLSVSAESLPAICKNYDGCECEVKTNEGFTSEYFRILIDCKNDNFISLLEIKENNVTNAISVYSKNLMITNKNLNYYPNIKSLFATSANIEKLDKDLIKGIKKLCS